MARRTVRGQSDDAARPAFEFCIAGRPVSAQAENRRLLQAWKAKVSAAARSTWPERQALFAGDLELRVTHYAERRIADRDNLVKPIQDALQGVAFHDDLQIRDCTSNWRSINGRYKIRFVSMPLAVAFSNGQEFLHIRLWISPGMEDFG